MPDTFSSRPRPGTPPKVLADNLTSRLEATYNLLEGMSKQPLIQDTGVSVMDRAMSMKTYADAFKFWMIGVVDPDGTISSTLRPKIGKVERDYIPRIMCTGTRELSDPFSAGATGEMSFTQFRPVTKDGKVVSICFVSIPLTHMSRLPPFRARTETVIFFCWTVGIRSSPIRTPVN